MTEHDQGEYMIVWEEGYDAGVRSCQSAIDNLRAELGSALMEINRLALALAEKDREIARLREER